MLIHHHYSQKLEFGNSLNRNSTDRVTSSSYFKKCHFCQVQRYFTDVLQKETKCIYTRSQLFIHLLSYHTAVAFFFGCLFVLKILHTSVTHWRFNSQQFMSAPLTITSELYYCTTNINSAACCFTCTKAIAVVVLCPQCIEPFIVFILNNHHLLLMKVKPQSHYMLK